METSIPYKSDSIFNYSPHFTEGRLLNFVMTLLSTAKPNQIQIPPGYGALSEEVNGLCGKFMKIASYNKAVFGYHYGDLIAAIMREKTDPV